MPREEMVSGADAENIVGALTNALTRGVQQGWRPGPARTVAPPQFSQTQLANQVGGTQDNRLRAPLGLGAHVFTDNEPFKFIVEPQEAFRGERLIIADSGETGFVGVVDLITVGSLPQTPSTEFGLPFAMFRPDATDAQMDWQIAPAGTKIMVSCHIEGTFGEGDTFTASLGLYGVWIRG